jgi:hypothetical protein
MSNRLTSSSILLLIFSIIPAFLGFSSFRADFVAWIRGSIISFGDDPSQPCSPNIFFMGERDLFFGETGGRTGLSRTVSSCSDTSTRVFDGDRVMLQLIMVDSELEKDLLCCLDIILAPVGV